MVETKEQMEAEQKEEVEIVIDAPLEGNKFSKKRLE